MNRIQQEILAGKIESTSYDCELPPEVRSELTGPRRPPIPPIEKDRALSVPKPESKAPFYFVFAICLVALAGAIYASWRQWDAERAKTNQAISQPLAPQPTPVTLPPGNASRWLEYLTHNPPALRAVLVKLPPPRAQLVHLPEWRIGERRPVMMPYNIVALATYKGRLAADWMLPSSGNQIGDMWVIGQTPWVWIWAPGATHADWIDP